MTAIVTDARYRMSLAVIRSLGRAGVDVICQEERGIGRLDALGFHSRYADRRWLTASPRRDPEGFVADLLARSQGGEVLLPMSLAAILAVAERSDRVRAKLRVLLPPLATIITANDKARVIEAAERAGVPAPRTIVLPPGADPGAIVDKIDFPVVVKYREGEKLGLGPRQRYSIIRDRGQFAAVYREMAARQESPLVQEYVEGDGWGISAVMNRDSEPVAVFCHHRLREYPVTGGPSCFAESHYDPQLIEYGVRLLKALGWQGVAMVEFKRERSTGRYKLMEINPRFWGSLPLAVAAGVDMPTILYRVAAGEPVAPVLSHPTGVRMRYLFQDLLSLPGYLGRTPNRAAFLGGFLRDLFDPRVTDGVFRLNDPLPGLAYALRALRRAGRAGE